MFCETNYVAAEGSGTSSAPHSYRFVDAAESKAGPRYFRLYQDDGSGSSHYFAPQLLNFEAPAAYPT